MKMYRTKEPLRISNNGDDRYSYILPVGAVLYYDHDFDEGHSLYWTPVYHKGRFECEEVLLEPKHQGRLVVPLWLDNIDAAELKFLFNRFPLSRSDVEAVIKANHITKDDLIDIIRSMPE